MDRPDRKDYPLAGDPISDEELGAMRDKLLTELAIRQIMHERERAWMTAINEWRYSIAEENYKERMEGR